MIFTIENPQVELSYKILTVQPLMTGWDGTFSYSFGNTGNVSSGPFVWFYGQSGKLYDQEGNYFNSYDSHKILTISGNIYSGHHNYFFNGDLIHDSCYREGPGSGINALYVNNFYTGFGAWINGTGVAID
jgi:hypothetical protein